jgi:branched-subunit amino acid ABC-type transport system permease component
MTDRQGPGSNREPGPFYSRTGGFAIRPGCLLDSSRSDRSESQAGAGFGWFDGTVRSVADFFQTLIATLAVGSLYALVALGYTLVYGVLKFINFAHSDIFVLGAWTSFTGATLIGTWMGPQESGVYPWWVGVCVLLLAIAVCATTGYLIERFAYRPLRRAPRLNVLITAIGVSLLLQNVGQLPGRPVAKEGDKILATIPFGAIPKSMPGLLPDRTLNETTIARGTMDGGSRRGVVKLDRAITLEDGRSYRLEVTRRLEVAGGKEDGGQTRVESLSIAADAGPHPAGEELATQPRRNPQDVHGASYRLVRSPLVPIRLIDVLIVASSLVLMAGLQFLVFGTKLGTAMRATSFNVDNASLMGVNVNRVISFTFVLGTALAAAASFLYSQKYPGLNQTASNVWVILGLKAFVAAVVGGIGNVRGAVLGGFLIAGLELFGALYSDKLITSMGGSSGLGTSLVHIYVFGLLIVVLLVRPSGLLGSTVREKV